MVIHFWRQDGFQTSYLNDIHENTTYGHIDINKEGNVIDCSVGNIKCKSRKEWWMLIKHYMEE